MGIADVIPGVSGGTLALILGVYKELVDTIKGLSPRFLLPLFAWVKSRSDEDRAALVGAIRELNLGFLITLGAGIATALGVGSVVIPHLMELYPVQMRAFFFGLIIASVWVPFRMIGISSTKVAGIVGATVIAGLAFGYVVTDPSNSYETTRESFEVTSEGETLEDLTRKGPSALASAEVFWAAENEALRDAVKAADPEVYEALRAAHAAESSEARGKDAVKARSAPYDEVVVPAGTPVQVPRPELWFVFVAGLVAICAMILPGISGSYILLIFNVYFFILNALKGFLQSLAAGVIPLNQGVYVIVFCAGCAIGILSFARVLSYLLDHHPAPTLGVLVGLMLGCLRGIWPFRDTVDGVITNVAPGGPDLVGALFTFGLGLAIVGGFTYIGRHREMPRESQA